MFSVMEIRSLLYLTRIVQMMSSQVDGTANNVESNGSSGFESVMMFVMFGMISAVLILLVLTM